MKSINKMTFIAIIAGIYTTISLVLAPYSFLSIQVRVSEALMVLAIIKKESIYGLVLGCFITNLIGVLMGVNTLGLIDVVVGTAASYLAAIIAYKFKDVTVRKVPLISLLSFVLVNGVFIGLEFTFVFFNTFNIYEFLIFFMQISIGQLISIGIFGYPLYLYLKNNPQIIEIV